MHVYKHQTAIHVCVRDVKMCEEVVTLLARRERCVRCVARMTVRRRPSSSPSTPVSHTRPATPESRAEKGES